MSLEKWITLAREQGASDLHLEGGMPIALRVRGQLRMVGEPIAPSVLTQAAKTLLTDAQWSTFRERQSEDLSRTISGIRCRINVLRSSRGVGFAIRLLTNFQANLRRLNLHPDLARLTMPTHGLVLICGTTGSGKSSTLAALIQEINLREARHIVTVESPIEYNLAPRKSLIRQREVGRDTPSFEQALLDAMREDPDVLMVGEMRDSETMRLTLNAAETGHLVLATLHSSSTWEALARIVAAFPAESQNGVAAQIADCLVGVVCQRLTFRTPHDRLAPECEILLATPAAKGTIRQGQFSKLQSVLEGGGLDGCWTFGRYREWLARRGDWYLGGDGDLAADPVVPRSNPLEVHVAAEASQTEGAPRPTAPPTVPRRSMTPAPPDSRILEIGDIEDDPAAILRILEGRRT